MTPYPTAAELVAASTPEGVEPQLRTASLAGVLSGSEEDPHGVVAYLHGTLHLWGLALPREVADLMDVNEDLEEDGLGAHRVAEGVLVSYGAEGLWALLT
jgi:hypothetical protein